MEIVCALASGTVAKIRTTVRTNRQSKFFRNIFTGAHKATDDWTRSGLTLANIEIILQRTTTSRNLGKLLALTNQKIV
jgi:hypothetical protein